MYPVSEQEAQRLKELEELGIICAAPDDDLDAIVRLTQGTFQVPIALVSLLDEHRQWFKSRVGLDHAWTPREQAFCNHTILGDDVLVVEDATRDARFCSHPAVTGPEAYRFYAGAPLVLRPGIQIGTLCVVDVVPRKFSDEDCQKLKDLAQITTAQLRSHHARATMQREIGLRSATEATLREQKRLLKLAEKLANVGHWRIALPSQAFTWSDEVYRIFGLPHESTPPDVPSAIAGHCHPDDRPKLEATYANLIAAGNEAELEIRLKRVDGDWRHVAFRAICETSDDGRVTGLFGVIIDLTDIKRAERQARDSAHILRSTLDNMDQGLMMVDADGIVQVCNQRARELLELPDDLVREKPHFSAIAEYQVAVGEFVDNEEADWLQQDRSWPLRGPLVYERERPNGTALEIRTVHLSDGSIVRTYTDTTVRRRADVARIKSEAQYRTLADVLPQKVWVIRTDDSEIYRNRQVTEYYGAVGSSLQERLSLNHPDDAARMWHERQAGISSGQPFQYEGRLRRRDGEYRWHRLAFAPFHEGDTIAGWIATALDIEDSRRIQDDLKATTDLLQMAQAAAGAGT